MTNRNIIDIRTLVTILGILGSGAGIYFAVVKDVQHNTDGITSLRSQIKLTREDDKRRLKDIEDRQKGVASDVAKLSEGIARLEEKSDMVLHMLSERKSPK